jgi:hypothetical protein
MLENTVGWQYDTKPNEGDGDFLVAIKHLTAQFGMNGVEMVIDNAVHAPAGGFYGIQVTTAVTVANAALDADLVAGVDNATIVGTVLAPGYHPLSGTSIRFTDVSQVTGVAYLLRRLKTNPYA